MKQKTNLSWFNSVRLPWAIKRLEELTGDTYITDYYDGGWQMYMYIDHCPCQGQFGITMSRITTDEFCGYLDGLIKGLEIAQKVEKEYTKRLTSK